MNRNQGLTLLEVMIAVLILGLGMTAVAGLFPIAGTIQRRTYDDMVARQAGDSITSTIASRGFSMVDLINPLNPLALLPPPLGSGSVVVVPPKVMDGVSADALIEWGLRDRCYPTSIGGDPSFTNRSHYWVPLVRKPNAVDYQVFVFVLKKEPGVTYGSHANPLNPLGLPLSEVANPNDPAEVPVVRSLIIAKILTQNRLILAPLVNPSPVLLEIGDQVLDSEGIVHRVTDLDGNTLTVDGVVSPLVSKVWFAERSATGSPTRQILTLGNGVVLR